MTNQEKLIEDFGLVISCLEDDLAFAIEIDRNVVNHRIARLKKIKEKLPEVFDESFAAGQWDSANHIHNLIEAGHREKQGRAGLPLQVGLGQNLGLFPQRIKSW